jgi:hydrogenase-4 membrane subunit HyfE
MSEYIIRFVAGGLIVSAFAILSDMLRPKSFAGLLGAAPSVALATLGIAVVHHGATYAAAESWTMIYGAAALACYCLVVCHLLMRFRMNALPATVVSFVVWLGVAFGLLASLGGAT